MEIFIVTIGSAMLIAGAVMLFFAYRRSQQVHLESFQLKAEVERMRRSVETERKEALIKLKDELYKKRIEAENELKKDRAELERFQSKLNTRYEAIEKKEERLDDLQRELQNKERQVIAQTDVVRLHEQRYRQLIGEYAQKLESMSGLSRDDARAALIATIEAEVRMTQEKYIQKIEEDARQLAKERAITIVVNAMQRYTAEQVSEHSAGVVHLPNDEMKGRIIGKEGRNIKALEMATGMEFVIGDTPEIITISGFNPIRREVARRSLEKLIIDGRINPTRIEETVEQCEREVEELIEEYGKKTIIDFNMQGVKPEIISLLGKLYFRTSFSQNVLMHSVEVGLFSRMIAEELGLPQPELALRGGLLHDLGKSLSAECEGPHALIGADIARRCGEDPIVVNCIAAHHEEVPFTSLYAPIVMLADTISASRPGARRETLSTHIKRLEKLEELAQEMLGVKKAYALQAGREIRVIVDEHTISDERAHGIARELARRIEKEMAFPGQIKINVIREKRAIEYAR